MNLSLVLTLRGTAFRYEAISKKISFPSEAKMRIYFAI